MRPIADIASGMAQEIDRQFGTGDVARLRTYLERSLGDIVREARADTAVPEFADPVDALARYLSRREGHNPADPSLYLYHRQRAVQIINAVESTGLTLEALAGFYLVERTEDVGLTD